MTVKAKRMIDSDDSKAKRLIDEEPPSGLKMRIAGYSQPIVS